MPSSSSLPTPASPMKDPPGFRSTAMMDELEQLRQRGLAKRLNKHFTQECKRVEAELAAAEAALSELEARRKNAGKFKPTSHELTKLDAMCMKVAAWKKECKKKEQETVMLYARYVEKFGKEIKLAEPEELMSPNKQGSCSVASPASVLGSYDVETLTKAFEEAADQYCGIPDLIRPKQDEEDAAPSTFNAKELEEILEDSSLPDPDAKSLAAPTTPAIDAMATIDSDMDSVVSGLTTLNSHVTRECLQQVEGKVLDFIKNETENIRKLMEEDAASKLALSAAGSHASSRNDSIVQHENMVKQMEQILNDFKKAEEESKKRMTGTMVRRISAGSSSEDWYEHWDETYQRHFYVEAKTNTTQWHMPPSATELSCETSSTTLSESRGNRSAATTPSASSALAGVPGFEDFIPGPRQVRRGNRVEMYRRARRKQRKRQLVIFAVLSAVLSGGFLVYKHLYPEQVEMALTTASATVASTMEWTGTAPLLQPASKTETPKSKIGATVLQSKKSKMEAKKEKNYGVTFDSKMKSAKKVSSVKYADKGSTEQSPKATKPQKVKPTRSATKGEARKKFAQDDHGKETRNYFSVSDNSKGAVVPVIDETPRLGSGARKHWIVAILTGNDAFKDVTEKCREPGRYCGAYCWY